MPNSAIAAVVATAIAAGLALSPSLAQAQNTQPTYGELRTQDLTELDSNREKRDWTSLSVRDLTVDDLREKEVVDAAGEELGEVDKVLGNAAGQILAVAVEMGGFLDIGDKEVVIALEQLELQEDGTLRTGLSREQVNELPTWEN
ncbi:MAG: PRC-barrel domain-containing protein [Acetobacterales bacterium]